MTGSPWRQLQTDVDFRRYFLARQISSAGSIVTWVALPILVYARTHSALLTSLVSLFDALPYLLLGLLAGALADRWDRRRAMVICDCLSAVVAGSVPVAHLLGVLTTQQLLVVALVLPTLFVLFDASAFGALPTLVGRDRIASVNGIVWSVEAVFEIATPGIAGALLAFIDAATLMAVDAISFVASALLLRAITRALSTRDASADLRSADPHAIMADIREGVRWLWGHPGVRLMTAIGTAQSLGGGAFVGLLVVWADRRLDVRAGDWRLGALYATWSIGGLAASLVLPRLLRRVAAPRLTLLALPFSAALGIATTLAGQWLVAAIFFAGWGVAYTLVVINGISYRQQVTPDAFMSRVNAAGRMLSFGLGTPLGALLGGALTGSIGIRAALLVCLVPMTAMAVLGLRSPLRTASLDPAVNQA